MSSVWPTYHDVFLTLLRWGAGLVGGTVLGLMIAVTEYALLRFSRRNLGCVKFLVTTPLDFLRALPIIALVPVIQMIAINEVWKIGLIGWAVLFPTWVAIRQALARELVDTELSLRAAGLRKHAFFRSYRLPKALGGLLRGVEISIGVAWLSVVAGEWVGTFSTGFWSGGLGYRIVKAHDANSWSGMFACLALFGLSGSASSWTWRRFFSQERQITRDFNPLRQDGG